jgi:hypothetical protein
MEFIDITLSICYITGRMRNEASTPLEQSIPWIKDIPHVSNEYQLHPNGRELRVKNTVYKREFFYGIGKSTSYTYKEINLYSLQANNVPRGLIMGFQERTYENGEIEYVLRAEGMGDDGLAHVMRYTQDGHAEFEGLSFYPSDGSQEWENAGHAPFDKLPQEIDFNSTVRGLLHNAKILCFRKDPVFFLPVTSEDSEYASTH